MIEIFLCFSYFPFFASCFALRQNAFTIPWDFLFYILCNLGKYKRNYEYNLSLIYKVPITFVSRFLRGIDRLVSSGKIKNQLRIFQGHYDLTLKNRKA